MEWGFVMENRLFLLYFPGYYDGDEIIGIYDDISKLKASYERVISNPADEHGFQQYDFYLNNPCTKLTIEEYLKNMNMKEVDFFMEKFLPAYSMTLDESVTRLEG